MVSYRPVLDRRRWRPWSSIDRRWPATAGAKGRCCCCCAGGPACAEHAHTDHRGHRDQRDGDQRRDHQCRSSPAAAAAARVSAEPAMRSGATRSLSVGAAITSVGPAATAAGAVSSPGYASAVAKSAHVAKRSDGFLAIAFAITASICASSGRRSLTSGGGADKCWPMTTAGLECWNGATPVSRLKAVQPRAYWSARASRSLPCSCSGSAVRGRADQHVCRGQAADLAQFFAGDAGKSASRMRRRGLAGELEPSRMLAGLTSRCSNPREWA